MQPLITVAQDLQPLNLLAGYDWIILLVVAVLLFGGTRLAGIGKGAGRAIREFKEETDGLKTGSTAVQPGQPVQPVQSIQPGQTVPAQPVVPVQTVQTQPVVQQPVPSMDEQAAADIPPQQR